MTTADRTVAEMNRYSMLLPARGVSTPLLSHTWIVTLTTTAASVSKPDIICWGRARLRRSCHGFRSYNRRIVTKALRVVAIVSAVAVAPLVAQQNAPQLVTVRHATGQGVAPVYEGFDVNPDGS